jgi:hypothetical protein
LIENFFLDHWLTLLPDQEIRRRVQEEMGRIINDDRHGMDFDVSIKATLIIGRK